MKIATYSLITLTFSALIFNPIMPKDYPTEENLKEKRVVTFRELKLNHLIRSVEYQIVKDSIELETIKQNNN